MQAVPVRRLQIRMVSQVDMTTQSMQRLVEIQLCNMREAHLPQLAAATEVQVIGRLILVDKEALADQAAEQQDITRALQAKMVVVQLVKVMPVPADMAATFLAVAVAQALQVTQALLMARHRVVLVFKIVS